MGPREERARSRSSILLKSLVETRKATALSVFSSRAGLVRVSGASFRIGALAARAPFLALSTPRAMKYALRFHYTAGAGPSLNPRSLPIRGHLATRGHEFFLRGTPPPPPPAPAPPPAPPSSTCALLPLCLTVCRTPLSGSSGDFGRPLFPPWMYVRRAWWWRLGVVKVRGWAFGGAAGFCGVGVLERWNVGVLGRWGVGVLNQVLAVLPRIHPTPPGLSPSSPLSVPSLSVSVCR